MKNKIIALLMALTMLFTTSVFAQESEAPVQETPQQQIEKVEEYSNYMIKYMIRYYSHLLADNYYYGVDDNELLFSVITSAVDEGKVDINKALEAMIKTLKDDHAEFYTPEEYKEMTENIAGEFAGIGVTIQQHENGALVVSVIENGPAYKAGIIENDYIIAVNGKNCVGLSAEQVRNIIVGEIGTEVKVKINRKGEEIEVTCVRDTVSVSHIETSMVDDKTAYMKLLQFSSNAPEEIEAYVSDIRAKKVEKLIIDLRDNPGGDLQAAIDIANIFISRGKIAQLKYKKEELNKFIYSENYNAPNFETVVLINEHSASASEFLAMAFQSRGAAKIIGTKSYGKGSMQILNRAATGAGFKYTIGEFYSYKGKRVNTVGITPDIVVENDVTRVPEETFAKIDFDRINEGATGGEMTLALEQRLQALGYLGEADAIFDDTTKDAVSRFQAVVGNEITGVPGFLEYLYLNDYNYESLTVVVDNQLQAAKDYLAK